MNKYMNRLLSLQCPSSVDEENQIYTFDFELHCVNIKIVAKKIEEFNQEKGYTSFEILSFTP